jgi:hypothetical protein
VRRVAALVAGLVVGLGASSASAHHVPGHGASEGVRNLNSLGGGAGQATTRFAILQEFSRNTSSLNPGTTSNTSLLGEYAPHPWFSFGLQAPLLVVDEDAPNVDTKVGYGDTRMMLRLTPHADKLIHRVLTTGINLSFPTRTVQFEADPGRSWTVTPNVLFTRTYLRPFWQLMGLATIEHRPAGTAIDISAGAQIGYRIKGVLAPSFGALADLRVATFCTPIGGGAEASCREGRPTETEREVGSLRLANISTLTYSFATWGMVSASVQLPMIDKRDFDWAGSLSTQFMF